MKEFVTGDDNTKQVQASMTETENGLIANDLSPQPDGVRMHSRNILQFFFTLEDYQDAVKQGDRKRMSQIHKDVILYFKTDSSFSSYALEMMVNVA